MREFLVMSNISLELKFNFSHCLSPSARHDHLDTLDVCSQMLAREGSGLSCEIHCISVCGKRINHYCTSLDGPND